MNEHKSEIIYEKDTDTFRYFDKNGTELHDGDMVEFDAEATLEGKAIVRKLHLTEDGELGIDATNPKWIEDGRAFECQFGIYPLHNKTMQYVAKLD